MKAKYKLAFGLLRPMKSLPLKNFMFLIFICTLIVNCSGTRPAFIGQFSPCPDKPNCVSSKSSLSLHKIDLLIYEGSPQEARKRLLNVIKSMPRTQISRDKDNFIHAEFTSKIFRFVDDVEFYFEKLGTIHFRSASRLGYSDMGVNRKRMEEIRHLFNSTL